MLDPFTPPLWLRAAVEPVTERLHLLTLTLHAHELLFSFVLYSFIDAVVAPLMSQRLFPALYGGFSERTRLQWNMHIASLVNSTFLSIAIPFVLLVDRDRANGTWEEHLWGYTGAAGLVQALGAGYFVWDLRVCAANVRTLGVLDLLHAVVALSISTLGFRPFGLYYGIQYGLVELSTPFVNIHWFLNKTGRAGSKLQVANGIVLIITFFCCRLLWGAYMIVTFFSDVWTALQTPTPSSTLYYYSPGEPPLALEHRAPWWVAIAFMLTHIVVMSLSAFWFGKMVSVMWGHIQSQRRTKEKKAE